MLPYTSNKRKGVALSALNVFAKSKIRPCQRRGQLFAENEICATVQYHASPISVYKALLNSGLEVTATQVIKLFSYFSITQASP